MKKLIGKYIWLYPSSLTIDAFAITDTSLVKLNSVEEMQDNAGYLMNISPIFGDYTKSVQKVAVLDSGTLVKIGYAAASRLEEQIHPIVIKLNETSST